jgi:uncharacterized caspase-like protein/WD40 repeat protein
VRLWLRLLLLVAALIPASAGAETSFFLDLDAGGHRAFVKELVFTPDGQFLLSASDDKTVRVWDASTGVTVRTLRGQIGPGNEGKIFALAVSPDGRTLAVGGYFGPGLGDSPPYGDVRLFDLRSGKILAVLKAHEYAVYALAFSPDGAMLAAGGQDGFAYLWRRDEAAAEGWTPFSKLDADSWHLTKLAFLAGGTRLAAATADNGFRLWRLPEGEEITLPEEAEAWRDESVRALAVSMDGKTFATGNEAGRVALWSAEDGNLLGELPQQEFAIGSLQLAGERIAVSCGYRCAEKNRTSVWTLGAQKPLFEHGMHDGSVFAGAVSPDGSTIATAGGTKHAIRLWDAATGEERKLLEGRGAPVMAVGLDARAQSVAWGAQNPCPERVACPDRQGRLETSLKLPTTDRFLEQPEPLTGEGEGFSRAVHEAGGWSLKAEEGGEEGLANAVLAIFRDGAPARKIVNEATTGYLHAAFTLLGGGSRLVTGGNDGTIIEYATDSARLIGEFRGGHTGEVHAIAASEKLNLLLTGSADQTLGLWNLKTRELIVSLFFAGKEWVIWTPQGYYFSSDEGDKLIGWHVNQGPDKEARFVRAAQLKRHLWSPELVRRAIILQSAEAAVKEMRPGVDRELEKLLGRKPPEFEVKVAADQSGVAEGFVALEIVAEPGVAEGAELSILSGSRHVGAGAATRAVGEGRRVVEVPVEEGENQIAVTLSDSFGYMTERGVKAIGRKREQKKRGKLFVAVIGVEDYPLLPEACAGRSCDLRYPVDDAAEFLNVLAKRSAPMFSELETLVLVNREALGETPEREQALDGAVGLDSLLEPEADTITDELADFLDRPGPDDTTFVFVAGHGVNVDEDYYFVPTDGRMADESRWRRSSLVDWADIQKAVERAEGTRVMLLDTCHAQNSFNPRLEKDAADARIVVFSATAANSTAAELPELGHGVFTFSLLEGLRGKAARGADGVRLLDLASYLSREVTRLTQDRQKPFYYISNMEDILLAGPSS